MIWASVSTRLLNEPPSNICSLIRMSRSFWSSTSSSEVAAVLLVVSQYQRQGRHQDDRHGEGDGSPLARQRAEERAQVELRRFGSHGLHVEHRRLAGRFAKVAFR